MKKFILIVYIFMIISLIFIIINFRISELIFYIFFLISALTFIFHKNKKIVIISFLLFIIIILIPIDITLKNYKGTPKLIPVVYGKPTQEIIKKSENGEVYLGSCIVPLCKLKYVVAW